MYLFRHKRASLAFPDDAVFSISVSKRLSVVQEEANFEKRFTLGDHFCGNAFMDRSRILDVTNKIHF